MIVIEAYVPLKVLDQIHLFGYMVMKDELHRHGKNGAALL
jgi:hypothetical protein